MRSDHAVGSRGDLRQLGDGKRRRVGGQDGFGRQRLVKRPEDVLREPDREPVAESGLMSSRSNTASTPMKAVEKSLIEVVGITRDLTASTSSLTTPLSSSRATDR